MLSGIIVLLLLPLAGWIIYKSYKEKKSERSNIMSAPKREYSEIVRKVKNGLAVIRAEADFLLRIETLTGILTGENHLEEIKKQVKRINDLLESIKG